MPEKWTNKISKKIRKATTMKKKRRTNSEPTWKTSNSKKLSTEISWILIASWWPCSKRNNNNKHTPNNKTHPLSTSLSFTFLFRSNSCFSTKTSRTSKPNKKKTKAEWWFLWPLQKCWSSSQWRCSCLSSKKYCPRFVDYSKKENSKWDKMEESLCVK